MSHRPAALALSLLAVLALGAGCADNSGGPSPEGTALEEFTPAWLDAGGLSCEEYRDAAFLIHDSTEAQAFLDSSCALTAQPVADEFLLLADALEDTEALVVLTIELGGCLGEYGVFGFYLSDDGDTVTGWVKRADSSYGRQNVACPADIGQATELWRVMGAADATQAEILVGVFNPSLPGAPALPGG